MKSYHLQAILEIYYITLTKMNCQLTNVMSLIKLLK